MIWLKKNLSFAIAMVVLAAVLAVEIYMILGQRAATKQAESDFLSKVDEYRRLSDQAVLPHAKNVELTAEEIERQRKELELYQSSLLGNPEIISRFSQYPTSRSNAFFEIASFVDDYRARARSAGLPAADVENSHFGFEAYATVGPADERIPGVHKEKMIMAHILDRLFEARPQSLIGVRRPGEGAPTADPTPARGGAPAQQGGGAGFRLNPQLTAAIPAVANTSAYQVAFTGRASTLRTFLNELSSFDMPLIVRNVQVAPATEAPGRRQDQGVRRPARRVAQQATSDEGSDATNVNGATEAREGAERIPLVADNLSRFIVSMEFVDVLQETENSR
jgi:hypothetical protein